jgi:hypothetical protein
MIAGGWWERGPSNEGPRSQFRKTGHPVSRGRTVYGDTRMMPHTPLALPKLAWSRNR